MNSADNGNSWVEVLARGTIGITSKGEVNRDGIGAVITFTPEDGNPVMQLVLGGSSHLSQDSLAQNFGLGSEDKGTVEILWPEGVRNRLYGINEFERIVFPEIPCSYTGEWEEKSKYVKCVEKAIEEVIEADMLNPKEAKRFRKSAIKAFARVRQGDKHHEDDAAEPDSDIKRQSS